MNKKDREKQVGKPQERQLMDAPEHFGKWATDRIRERLKKPRTPAPVIPQEIKDWLDTGGSKPAGKDTPPTGKVLGWLVATLVDPDWSELQ